MCVSILDKDDEKVGCPVLMSDEELECVVGGVDMLSVLSKIGQISLVCGLPVNCIQNIFNEFESFGAQAAKNFISDLRENDKGNSAGADIISRILGKISVR